MTHRILLALALLLAAFPAGAQAPAPAADTHPDVLVLVYQQSGKGDLVDITYAHTVPHVQAQRDLDALAQASGWAIGPGKVSDGQPPVQGKIGPMTSTVLTVPGVIRGGTQPLPVAPFVTAFRGYKRLALIFSVAPDFSFQGPRAYADTNVQIGLTEHQPVYTYQVQILNPQFGALSLPQSSAAANAAGRGGPPRSLLLWLLAAALAAGTLVYVTVHVLTARASRRTAGQDDTHSEEKTTLGTKR